MIKLDRIYINIKKCCVKYYIRISQKISYISQIPSFNGEHSDMSIYRTLKKSWILIFLKKIYFSILKEERTTILFYPQGCLLS